MPDAPQSPPVGDNIAMKGILSELQYLPGKDMFERDKARRAAMAQLNAYILAEVKELIGEDEVELRATKAGMNDLMYMEYLKTIARNKLRTELRQAATARFGAGEGKDA